MSGYIGNIGDVAVAGGDQIDEIATDTLTGARDAIDLIQWSGAANQWDECLLDAVRKVELVLYADGFRSLGTDEAEEEGLRQDDC